MRRFKFWAFLKLLKWYSSEELDQWDMWKISTRFGTVYITISRTPGEAKDANYDQI